MNRFTADEARKLLQCGGLFFHNGTLEEESWDDLKKYYDSREEYDEEVEWESRHLNMNDVWGWALAMGEPVPDEELPRLADLFWRYGWGGVLYWVSERNDGMRSAFHDNNRAIEFVRNEEAIRAEIKDSSKLAYTKREYTIGAEFSEEKP